MRAISRTTRAVLLSMGCLVLLAPMAMAQFDPNMPAPNPGEDYTSYWQRALPGFPELLAEVQSETIEQSIANLSRTRGFFTVGDVYMDGTAGWIKLMREWPRVARILKDAREGDDAAREKIRNLVAAECEAYAKDWPLTVEIKEEDIVLMANPMGFINSLPKNVMIPGDAVALPILLLAVETDSMKALNILERMFVRNQENASERRKARTPKPGSRIFTGDPMVATIAYAAFGYAQQINGDEKAMTALSPSKSTAVQEVIRIVTETATAEAAEGGAGDPEYATFHKCGQIMYFVQVMCSNE